MLRQVRLCGVDATSAFGCRTSIIRLFYRACSSHRSVLSDSPAAAAKDPRSVMLNLRGRHMDDSFVANAKTVAESLTFTGQHLRVSLGGAAPPATAFLYYDFPDSVPGEDDDDISVYVVAAHTDSVLLRMGNKHCLSVDFEDNDSFVYGADATWPPSLSLLPNRDFLTKTNSVYAHRPSLYSQSTGLLRRGENDDDLLVVQVQLWYDRHARRQMAEFCLLHPGMRQWELMEPVPIILHDQGGNSDQVRPRSGDVVIPIDDRYLFWVDYKNGFVLCDMAEEASRKH